MRANRLNLPRRLVIWVMIFVLQLLFIGSYWLIPNNNIDENSTFDILIPNTKFDQHLITATRIQNVNQGKINFITKLLPSLKWQAGGGQASSLSIKYKEKIKLKSINNYKNDFHLKRLIINQTEEEAALGIWNETADNLWCFTEGLDHSEEATFNQNCKCKIGWHGKDCGQPEVIWRALMTAKQPTFKFNSLLVKDKNEPTNKLIAFIEGNFLNLDMLELQLASIVKVVDYFMLFLKININIPNSAKAYDLKSLEKRLEYIIQDNQRYELYSCYYFINNSLCTTQKAFQLMHQRLENLKPNDLFLYLYEQTIIATAPLKFLKYYANDIDLIRFRLKYNVYGYFWQHEQQTHLNGLLSSFLHLDNQQGDVDKLFRRAYASNSLALIIGDLNHFGGWYCEYCLQPNEIILQLHIINASSLNKNKQNKQLEIQQQLEQNQSQSHLPNEQHPKYANEIDKPINFPNKTKTHNIIDIEYIQKLISNGIHMDGRTKLLKMHYPKDKYYAPLYAQEHSWKFGSFLVNLYESLDSEDDDDNDIVNGY